MRGVADLISFQRGDPFEFGRGASRHHNLWREKIFRDKNKLPPICQS
jgi:hypothetical protein